MSVDRTGTEILGHRLVALVGRGSAASVWRATHPDQAAELVVKILEPAVPDDPQLQLRFQQEGLIQLHMRHPNIARVEAYSPEHLAFITELVPGKTLGQVMAAEGGPMRLADAMPILRPLLDALEFAHRQGEVHRDLRPSNVMVTPEGDVRVLDFGIATILGDARGKSTSATTVMGNADYLAPEQITGTGAVNARSDIYALGVIMYRLLVGRLPFEGHGDDFAVRHAHVEEAPPDPRKIHPALGEAVAKVILRALEKAPDKRFAGIHELRRDLEAAVVAEDKTRVEWMVRGDDDSDEVGPVSLDQLERGLAAGKVPPGAKIAREGSSAWEPAKAILERLAAARETAATPPMRPRSAPPPEATIAAAPGVLPLAQMKTEVGALGFMLGSAGTPRTPGAPPAPPALKQMPTQAGTPLFAPPPEAAPPLSHAPTEVGGALYASPEALRGATLAPGQGVPQPAMRTEVGGPLFAPPAAPAPGPYPPPGQYPAGQYPAGQYPAGQYPAGQYPAAPAVPAAAPMAPMMAPAMAAPAAPRGKGPIILVASLMAVAALGVGGFFLVRSFLAGPGGLAPVKEGTFHAAQVLPNGPVGIRLLEGGKPDHDHVVITQPSDAVMRVEHKNGHGVVTATDEYKLDDDGLIKERITKNQHGRTTNTETWTCESPTSCLVTQKDADGRNGLAPCGKVRVVEHDGGVKEEVTCVDDNDNPMTGAEGIVTRIEQREEEGLAQLALIRRDYFDADKNPVASATVYAASVRFKRDDRGCTIQTTYFDARDNPENTSEGHQKRETKVDEACRTLETAVFAADGDPVPDSDGVHRYKYTYEDGEVVEVAYFDADDKPVTSTMSDAHIIRFKRDDRGNVLTRSYHDVKGDKRDANGVHEVRMEYDDNDLLVSESRFLSDGSPANLEWHRQTIKYSDMGLEEERTRFDATGALTVGGADAPIIRQRYDDMGRDVSMSCWKTEKEPAFCPFGYHERRVEHDDNGCVSDELYFDAQGKPTLLATGVHRVTTKNDSDCNALRVERFKVDGSKANGVSGAHRTVSKFKHGKLTSQASFDKDDKPLWTKRVHEMRYRYDKRGRLVEESSFGPDDKPVVDGRGVHKRLMSYDDLGRVASETRFGADDKPAFSANEQHIVKHTRDAHGRITESSYWGPDNAPSYHGDSAYHLGQFTHDAAGRRLTATYWLGKDVPGVEGSYSDIHKQEETYDDNGCVTETRRFAATGKPSGDYAKIKYVRDNACRALKTSYHDAQGLPGKDEQGVYRYELKLEHGRVLEERRFDRDDKATVAESDGAHLIKLGYDNNGRVTERAVFDKDNAALKGKGDAPVLRYKYDADGNKTEEALFDEAQKPTATASGVHRTVFQYDPYGQQTEKAFFKVGGEAAEDGSDVHKYVERRDRFGRIVEEAELGASGKSRKRYDEVKVKRKRFDDDGNLVAESYWDNEGKPSANWRGIHEERYKLEGADQLVERSFFDVEGKATGEQKDGGAHREEIKRNPQGDILEWLYFGKTGEPVKGDEGHHRVAYQLDAMGNQTEQSWWDAGGKPAANRGGTHRLVLERNPRGWVTAVRWFDKEGKPAGREGTERRFVYDGRGNWTSLKSFKDGSPNTYEAPFCLSGYHEVRRKIDAQNQIELVEYFRADGSAATVKEICDLAVSFSRVEFVHEKNKLVRQNLYELGSTEKSKTLECEKGYCLSPGGQNVTWGGR